ncbi:hypothetical protein ACIBF1_36005 [Spirillospora sp. NPDC050679]
MGQPGMRITVDAAMRARDVSAPRSDGDEAPPPAPDPATDGGGAAESANAPAAAPGARPARRTRAAKNERRRLGKRGGAR